MAADAWAAEGGSITKAKTNAAQAIVFIIAYMGLRMLIPPVWTTRSLLSIHPAQEGLQLFRDVSVDAPITATLTDIPQSIRANIHPPIPSIMVLSRFSSGLFRAMFAMKEIWNGKKIHRRVSA